MDILSYLSELVQTRKFVGIAGLGTLYKKKQPGRYDAATHAFVPPSYTLQFTSEIKEDTILPDYISKKRNVSADTANYFITEFSEALLKELDTNQQASLGELGKLVKNDGEYVLEAAEKLNYGFEFYGLPSINTDEKIEPAATTETDLHEVPAEELIPEMPVVAELITEEPFIEEIAVEPVSEEINEQQRTDVIPVEDEVITDATIAEEVTPIKQLPATAQEEIPVPDVTPFPEPDEEPTLESVIADNEMIEENPGDDQQDDINTAKDEQQLRAEIEALNFYRSKSPAEKPLVEEHEEVIWHLNITNPKTAAQPSAPAEAPEVLYPVADIDDHKTTPMYVKVLLALLILAIVLAAAYFVKPEWFDGLRGIKPVPAMQKVQPAVAVPVDTVDEDSLATSAPVSDTLAVKDTLATAAVPGKKPADTGITYEIIGASMHDQREADGFIAQMKKSGIKAKVVTNMSGKRLKMSIATLKDEESAKRELERLSKKLKIEGIYIYRNKQ